MSADELIELVPPSPRFGQLYAEERLRIAIALRRCVASIEHIGSTAIVGIRAKPIVDILIGVREPPLTALIQPLVELGYEHASGAGGDERLVFVRGTPRAFHVHVVLFDGDEWRRHIIFRDWLNLHPEVAAEYEALKVDLASRLANDRAAYTAGKTAFCERVAQDAARFPALRLAR
ncbi:MAG: GrpB family protein [Polyangiaceae bacterium]